VRIDRRSGRGPRAFRVGVGAIAISAHRYSAVIARSHTRELEAVLHPADGIRKSSCLRAALRGSALRRRW
jgi:hypothetical protein